MGKVFGACIGSLAFTTSRERATRGEEMIASRLPHPPFAIQRQAVGYTAFTANVSASVNVCECRKVIN